jgi:hypothetical protein
MIPCQSICSTTSCFMTIMIISLYVGGEGMHIFEPELLVGAKIEYM